MSRIGLHQGSRRRLAIGASANFLIKTCWKVIGLISTVLLARLLGVEGLGTYAFAFAIVGFATTFGTASMKSLIVQKLAGYLGLQEWSLARGLQRRSREMGLASATFLAVCVGFAAWYFVEPDESQLRLTLVIAVIMVPVVSQIHLNSSILQGLGHVIVCQLPIWVVRPLVFLALLLVFYFVPQIELSAPVAMVAQVFAATITLIVGVSLLWPRIPVAVKTATPVYETRDWLRAGFPFLAIGVLQQVNMQADVLFLGTIAGTEAVGIYRPAATIALMIMFGADAVALTIRPNVAHRYATGRTEGFQRLSAYGAWAGFGVAFLGAAVALLFGDLILLVFGPGFGAGAMAMGILCVGRVIFAALGQPGVFLEMTGRQSITMWGAVWAAGTNILLNLILIPQFGVNGAAIATASSLLVFNIHNMIAVRRQLSINTSIFCLRFRFSSTG